MTDHVREQQVRLMADPKQYIDLLRRMNMLHCIWHLELQARIAMLEQTIEEMQAKTTRRP